MEETTMSYNLQDSINQLRTNTRTLACLPEGHNAVRTELERRICIESLLSIQIGYASSEEKRLLKETLSLAIRQLRRPGSVAAVSSRLQLLNSENTRPC